MKQKKLDRTLSKLTEEFRLDTIIETLIKIIPWDDLLLAFGNVCVFKAMDEEARKKRNCKEYKFWKNKAQVFSNAMVNKKTATVLQRQIKKIKEDDFINYSFEFDLRQVVIVKDYGSQEYVGHIVRRWLEENPPYMDDNGLLERYEVLINNKEIVRRYEFLKEHIRKIGDKVVTQIAWDTEVSPEQTNSGN